MAAAAVSAQDGDAALKAELQEVLSSVLNAGLAARTYPGAWACVGLGSSRGGELVLAELGVGHLDWEANDPLAIAARKSPPINAAGVVDYSNEALAPPPPPPSSKLWDPVAVAELAAAAAAAGPNPVPSGEHTLWDVASLTKVIGTTTAALQLAERGLLDFDAPVQKYLPEWVGKYKEQVSVRMLLTHCAGLPSHLELWKLTDSAADAMKLVFLTELERPPHTQAVYSDLGILLLGEIIRRISGGQTVEQFCKTNLFEPLGMRYTGFCPPRDELVPCAAPTEFCSWRERLLRAEVHDENASFLGGVAPHAGLFATGHDLARFTRMLLRKGCIDDEEEATAAGAAASSVDFEGASAAAASMKVQKRILSAESIAMATSLGGGDKFGPVPGSNRALGWEKPVEGNSAGKEMVSRYSHTAFGHTGFTGTSMWMMPAVGEDEEFGLDAFIIILTNRVNPRRPPEGAGAIMAVRRALHDQAITVLRKHKLASAAHVGAGDTASSCCCS
jgi:CubicO group peptidase (beta-lactamase class C family)